MTTVERQINEDGDDCRYQGSSSQFLLTTWQEVGWWDAQYHGSDNGFRFINITVPKGAIIVSAYLSVKARTSYAEVVIRSRIKGEDIDTALIFTNVADFLARDRTTAIVDWDEIPAWTKDSWYTSPDIKTIIQEIIDRDGWISGNDLVIFWDDEEDRTDQVAGHIRDAYSYDDGAANSAKLTITYRVDHTVTVTDSLGIADSITKQLDKKKTVTDSLGILDSVARVRASFITVTDTLGVRDKVWTRKRKWPLKDLPDHTIRGGA